MTYLFDPKPWELRSVCLDGRTGVNFFPTDGVGVEQAKRVCEGCPVKEDCLEHAIVNNFDHGVWGGKSERQRRKIRRRQMVGCVEPEEDEVQVILGPPQGRPVSLSAQRFHKAQKAREERERAKEIRRSMELSPLYRSGS